MSKKLAQEKIDEIIKLYLNGNSARQISEILNVSTGTIYYYLKSNNVKKYKRYKLTHEQKQQICKEYESGISQEKIAKKFNVCIPTILNALKENNVRIRKQSEYRKYYINEHYFDEIDTPNKAYILGFLYADGYVSKEGNAVAINLQARDKHILDAMKKELEYERPLYFLERSKNSTKQDVYALKIDNPQIHYSLIKWGVVPNKTFVITYPDFLPDNLQKHFIRGLFDGDGTVSNPSGKSRAKVSFICGTQMLCNGIKEVIEREIGVNCKVVPYKNIYISRICGGINLGKFLSWLYDDAEMYLVRKYQRYVDYYKTA